jgi:hypothetical protein
MALSSYDSEMQKAKRCRNIDLFKPSPNLALISLLLRNVKAKTKQYARVRT